MCLGGGGGGGYQEPHQSPRDYPPPPVPTPGPDDLVSHVTGNNNRDKMKAGSTEAKPKKISPVNFRS